MRYQANEKELREIKTDYIINLFKGDNPEAFKMRDLLKNGDVIFYSYFDEQDNEIELCFAKGEFGWENCTGYRIDDDIDIDIDFVG